MHVLKDYPDVVKRIAFHETPIHTFLPNRTYWKNKNDVILHQVLTEGLQQGLHFFAQTLNIAPFDAKSMSQPVSDDDATQRKQYERMMFWAAYEIRQ
ncbi:hydrolase [Staphylococcus delphini]|nr:hydrolase [Staphylococcus delphini]